jgi:hypothetical protein
MKPDYRVLRMITGNKAFDASWAEEYGKALEGTGGPGRMTPGIVMLNAKLTVSQMLRLFRHKLIDGDALMVLQYRLTGLGPGRGRYATTVQVVDPDRLSNPQQNFDMPNSVVALKLMRTVRRLLTTSGRPISVTGGAAPKP